MNIYISPSDDAPIYRQIARQVAEAIAGGHLRPDDQLQSHRELALALVITPLTVKKAYDLLEREGYIHTLRGKGTFVSARPPRRPKRDLLEDLRPIARRLVSEAHLGGLEYSEVLDLLGEEQHRLLGDSLENGRKK